MKRVMPILLVLLLASPSLAARKWRTYEDCTLRENKSNDGDSFHVKYKRRHYIFRLYFVDAPEKDDLVPERLTEQAEYWGITEKDILRLGKEAAKFTDKYLSKEFTAYSRLRDARGQSKRKRYYAMIKVGDEYLSEALVREGLARIHGVQDNLPDGTKKNTFLWRLKSAEREAKQAKRGGWAKQLTRIEELGRRLEEPPPDLSAAAPTVAGPPEIEPQTITLERDLSVYSLKYSWQRVGILKAGAQVRVLGAESDVMVRIRFKTDAGKVYEAQCRRSDLGL